MGAVLLLFWIDELPNSASRPRVLPETATNEESTTSSPAVLVRGNFNLPSPAILRFHIFNKNKTATVKVKGAAVLAGSLQAGLEDVSKVDADDRFTVMTADKISGQFSNVPNGGRVNVYGSFDDLGNPIGDPVGTFRVSYNNGALMLSDFARK